MERKKYLKKNGTALTHYKKIRSFYGESGKTHDQPSALKVKGPNS